MKLLLRLRLLILVTKCKLIHSLIRDEVVLLPAYAKLIKTL